ncbi:MAG: H-NS histone family protein [Sagittula sp.]|uniref:H-NS histone family protein n=1 Tax=Sagittula sp. TaxID=2038081 RepID=UPI004059D573
MASFNLEEMSLDELKKLEKEVGKAIKTFESRRKAEARAAAEAAAREKGFSLAELAEDLKATKTAPKYRHPENPELTWTGRGRKPSWFIDALAAGTPAEDLLIEGT